MSSYPQNLFLVYHLQTSRAYLYGAGMPFGFGNFDFGFSERNPFGLRGRGIDYSGNNSGMRFDVNKYAAPVANYLVPTAQAAFPYTPAPNQSPAYSSSGQPNFNRAVSPTTRSRTAAPAPRAYASTVTPRVGATAQARSAPAPEQPSDVDQNALLEQQINDYFGGTASYLDQLQQGISGERDQALGAVASQFDAQRPFLQQARQELIEGNLAQQDAERVGRQNALAEARALYNELGQANRQRFGGTSSVGEFAGAIQGREFQRGQNKIVTTSEANLRSLQDRAQSIEQNYQNQLLQLEQQKNSALQQARSQYDDRVRQIDAYRFENEQAKAAAKIEALQDLRSRAQEIENGKRQFQSQIQAQTLAAAQNIYAAVQAYRAEQGQPVDLQNLPGASFSLFGGGAEQSPDNQILQGYFRPQGLDEQYLPTGLFLPEEQQVTTV